jgi:putative membrane protein
LQTDASAINRTLEAFLLILMYGLFAAHAGVHTYNAVNGQPNTVDIPWATLTLIFSSFVLINVLFIMGWRRGFALYGIALVVGFMFEFVGEKTGLIFGAYYYTDMLGPKILDTVPVIIPLAYFMVVWPCYLMANLLIRGKPVTVFEHIGWLLLASLLGALIMTAWDLVLDPLLSGEVGGWVWVDGGPYFGVPFQNFFGWVLTTFTISAIYRLVENRLPLKPLGTVTYLIVTLPIIGYAILGLGALFTGDPLATRAISPFAMGVAVVASLLRFYGPAQTIPGLTPPAEASNS